jgi:magnesium transporter
MTPARNYVPEMAALLRQGKLAAFVLRAHDLESADLAEVLAELDDDERVVAVKALPPELSGAALAEMADSEHAEDTLAALEPGEAAEIVDQLDDDDAADLLGELDPAEQEAILAEVEDRSDLTTLLSYDPETAGGRMTTSVVAVQDDLTAGQAIESIRRQAEDVEDFYQIFVVDAEQQLVGVLPLKDLVISAPGRLVREFMADADIAVTTDVDQEEVARLMARYNLASVPVVDAHRKLLGRVTFDDVSDVVEAETTEDMLQFAGVSANEELDAAWQPSVRSRLPWLLVNLCTAFAAKSVIDAQQDIVRAVPLIAAWLGVVAGMGGNAGTQALAVTVRRLALNLIAPGDAMRIIGKELTVGLVNGFACGLIVALVGYVSQGDSGAVLGLVVGGAMIGNLIVASIAGATIPLVLHRLKIDPAIASSIFVTTFTDVFGFGLVLLFTRWLLL